MEAKNLKKIGALTLTSFGLMVNTILGQLEEFLKISVQI
jgi:hypothetical protein